MIGLRLAIGFFAYASLRVNFADAKFFWFYKRPLRSRWVRSFPALLYFLIFLHYYLRVFITFDFMNMPVSTITSKGQTTVPSEVRKMFDLKPNTKIMWISMKPGDLSIVPIHRKNTKQDWVDELCGKYADDTGFDLTQSLIDDKKEDMRLEERPYLDYSSKQKKEKPNR